MPEEYQQIFIFNNQSRMKRLCCAEGSTSVRLIRRIKYWNERQAERNAKSLMAHVCAPLSDRESANESSCMQRWPVLSSRSSLSIAFEYLVRDGELAQRLFTTIIPKTAAF